MASSHKKGYRFEKWLIDDLRQSLDAKAHRTSGSGNGLDKNDIVCPNLEIEIEAKNSATWSMKKDVAQWRRQMTSQNKSFLIVRDPEYPETQFENCVVIMQYGDWKDLMKTQEQEVFIEPTLNYEQRSAMQSLKTALSRVNKVFNHGN